MKLNWQLIYAILHQLGYGPTTEKELADHLAYAARVGWITLDKTTGYTLTPAGEALKADLSTAATLTTALETLTAANTPAHEHRLRSLTRALTRAQIARHRAAAPAPLATPSPEATTIV